MARPVDPTPAAPPPVGAQADAWERLQQGTARGGLAFCVEHASPRVPPPLYADPDDRGWLSTHWGFDAGVRTVTGALVEQLGGAAVLARFSRLVVDANRPPDHPDLVRTHVLGQPLSFNAGLDATEIARRVEALHAPYHRAIDDLLRDERPAALVSVHSFTPVWAGRRRALDVGVLFDRCEAEARLVADALAADGLQTRLNEPYSGREGLIYAASRHGEAHGLPYIELELNQRLCFDDATAHTLADRLAPALSALLQALRG
ncbi:MAG: N-formylglutamate amidohydrolase [Alphaproteobacteria bacterium]|nr:N-formylglutamate amidohydrolase [Alphaproteobacteria bacterium]